MTLLERALRRLAHRGESGRQEIVERLAGGELGAELGGLRPAAASSLSASNSGSSALIAATFGR